MTIQTKLTKLISLFSSLIIFTLSAGLTLAGDSEAIGAVCVEQSIHVEGEYMFGTGYHMNFDLGEGWISVTRWYSPGQTYELYDANDGDMAYVTWFSDSSVPYVETYGAAHVNIYTGFEAGAMCNEKIDIGIYDGRINSHFNHMLASVYPASNGYDIFLYNPAIDAGEMDFNVTWSDIEAGLALAEETLEWQLVASGAAGSFYAGSGGECFVVSPNASGEMQTFSWTCA